ncbi:MAG: hypothetical protein SFY92_05840 [Verrucomicrobiae bacterium]|nr:hypothetical protein [Verrucomicrobiae bacterium]
MSAMPTDINPLTISFTADDIIFDCPSCGKNLVIEIVGAGMQINCPQCQAELIVPSKKSIHKATPAATSVPESHAHPAPSSIQPPPEGINDAVNPEASKAAGANALIQYKFDPSSVAHLDQEGMEARLRELAQLKKENHSQRLEAREYISHANAKLQREMSKLKRLEARRLEFDSEETFLKDKLGQ